MAMLRRQAGSSANSPTSEDANRLSGETNRPSEQENDQEQPTSNSNEGPKEGGDQEKQGGPPSPVGFFHPSLKHVRLEAVFKWSVTTALLMAFIIGVLGVYWGVFMHVEKNLSSLVVYVVDFDGQVAPYDTDGFEPVVGPLITTLARTMVASPTPNLGYEIRPPTDFNNDPIQVRQAVYDFQAWVGIVINPNATAMLYSAIQNGNASYDPMGACQLIFIDSRDDTNWYDFISPLINSFMTEATSEVGKQWASMVMQNATTNATLVQNVVAAPQVRPQKYAKGTIVSQNTPICSNVDRS